MEFIHPIKINPGDIDQLGHVNNVVYLNWVQEAAIAHWNHIATDSMKESSLWIVSRHEIDYLQPCYLNSNLIAKTWVGQSEGAKSERFVDIVDNASGKTMVKVKTTWYLLDAKTRKPKRIEKDFISLFN